MYGYEQSLDLNYWVSWLHVLPKASFAFLLEISYYQAFLKVTSCTYDTNYSVIILSNAAITISQTIATKTLVNHCLLFKPLNFIGWWPLVDKLLSISILLKVCSHWFGCIVPVLRSKLHRWSLGQVYLSCLTIWIVEYIFRLEQQLTAHMSRS